MIIFGYALKIDKLTLGEIDILDNEEIINPNYVHTSEYEDYEYLAVGIQISDGLDPNPIFHDEVNEHVNYKRVELMVETGKLPESIFQKFERAYTSVFTINLGENSYV